MGKLHSYGVSLTSLKLLTVYLTNQKQGTKVEFFYRSWKAVEQGVLQRFILGPLLYKIFLCGLFLMLSKILFAGYADDTIPYTKKWKYQYVRNIEEIYKPFSKCFKDNKMKMNYDEFYLLLQW